MKHLFILLLLWGVWPTIIAQNKVTGKLQTSDNANIIYHIKAKYIDSSKEINANFYEPSFEFEVDSLKEMQITFSADGYDTLKIYHKIHSGTNNVGEVLLYRNTIQLGEVVIQVRKNEIERNGPNYTLRNIQGTHIGNAGNLKDMLKWTPGMIVDGMGNISVLGAGSPIIYIDERKVINDAELEALSSTDVNSIEIIKEPDERYKNGTNAVVIIHLKKQIKDYVGGNISTSLIQRRRFGYNPRINLSGKKGIVSGNFSFSYARKNQHSYEAYQTIIQHGEDDIFRNSSQGGYVAKPDAYTLFGGLNFTLSPKSTLGIQYSGNLIDIEKETNNTLLLDNNGEQTPKKKNAISTQDLNLHNASVSYQWKRNENSTLTLITDYATRRNTTEESINELNVNTGNSYPTLTFNNTDYDIYTFNGNYSFKLGQKDKEQVGVEGGHIRNNSNSIINEVSQYINRKNQWLAAYLSFQRKWGKLNLQLGLRYEYDYTNTRLLTGTEQTDVKKTYSDLFPNARVTYKFNENTNISLGYRRSIARPSFSELSPIVTYEDSLNYWTGNPLLKPTFTNALSLTANLSQVTLRANYYYKTNPIVSIYGHDETSSNILTRQPQNIDHSQEWDVGIEYSQTLGKKVLISTFGYLTASYITYPYLGKETFYRDFHTFLGGYISYIFYKDFTIYANAYYTSPFREGTQKIGYTLDTNVGISGQFFNNKLYISLEGQDLFARGVTPWWENNYGDTNYWRRNKYDTRGIILTLRYTFNSIKTNFKSRSGNQKLLQRTN